MENKEDKTKKVIETLEKVSGAMDKGVEWTDKKLSEHAPGLLGSNKAKVVVGLIVLLVIAVANNPSLFWVAAMIGLVLYASQIVAAVKKAAAKKEQERLAREAAAIAAAKAASDKTEQ